MSQKTKQVNTQGGFWSEILNQIRLVVRLMGDRRVPFYLKLIPFASLIYWILPDLLPLIPFDDGLVIFLGLWLFIELCPEEIVAEHRAHLRGTIPDQQSNSGDYPPAGGAQRPIDPQNVIDTKFQD